MVKKSDPYRSPLKLGLWTDKGILWALVILSSVVWYGECGKYEDELILTAREKAALDKFKARVIPSIPKSSYLQNYIKDDLYFIRWLRAGKLKLDSAEEAFLNHLKWREEEKIDTIEEGDWEDFQTQYPIFVDTEDKDGRPVMELFFGDFKLREGVISGKSKEINRWITRAIELTNRRIYKARAAGKKVSQMVTLSDIQGFNFAQHGCPGCLRIYIILVIGYELNYPNILDTSFVVNMPPSFETILSLTKPLMRAETRNAINTFGHRKDSWMPVLDAKISRDQRSVRFGGKIVRDNE